MLLTKKIKKSKNKFVAEAFKYIPPRNEVPVKERKSVQPAWRARTERAAILAGLGRWEETSILERGSRILHAYEGEIHYISDIPETVLHVVVVEDARRRRDGYYRHEHYFGVFEARSQKYTSHYPPRPEDKEEFDSELERITTRPNRVAVNDLEDLIEDAVGKFRDFSEQRRLNSETNTQG